MKNIGKISGHIVHMRAMVNFDVGPSKHFGPEYIKENENTAHLVVPLLRALGWSDAQIAVEWYHRDKKRHLDVCLFETENRIPEKCCYLIEIKRRADVKHISNDPDESLVPAVNQAKMYACEFKCPDGKLPNFAVTDGFFYKWYEYNPQSEGEFECTASANLVDDPDLNNLHFAYLDAHVEKLNDANKSVLNLLRRMSPP